MLHIFFVIEQVVVHATILYCSLFIVHWPCFIVHSFHNTVQSKGIVGFFKLLSSLCAAGYWLYSTVQSESCIFSDLLKRHKLILYFISEITLAPILVSARGPLQSVSSLLLTLPHLEVTVCSTLSLLIPPSLHCLNVSQLSTRVFKNEPLRGEFPFS